MENVLSGISAWQVWVIVGIILCILEIFTPGFFIMALGIGCFFAAIGTLVFELNGQIAFFILGSLLFFFISRKLILPKRETNDEKFGIENLIGKNGISDGEITQQSGYIKVGGERWPARTDGDQVISNGKQVEIIEYSGNKLIVRLLKNNSQ